MLKLKKKLFFSKIGNQFLLNFKRVNFSSLLEHIHFFFFQKKIPLLEVYFFIFGSKRIKKTFKFYLAESVSFTKENGLIFYFDLSKVFFDFKKATERKKLVHSFNFSPSKILDLTCGVGSFVLYFLKFLSPKKIVALDFNKHVGYFLKKNLQANNFRQENVLFFCLNNLKFRTTEKFDICILNNPSVRNLKLIKKFKFFLTKDGIGVIYLFLTETKKKFFLNNLHKYGLALFSISVLQTISTTKKTYRFFVVKL